MGGALTLCKAAHNQIFATLVFVSATYMLYPRGLVWSRLNHERGRPHRAAAKADVVALAILILLFGVRAGLTASN